MINCLVIEDDRDLLRSILQYFDSFGYNTESAKDFKSGLDKVKTNNYDCIILDLNLPGGNGLSILHQLKENNSESGVIIISANNSLKDKVDGLELGADDYLTKPFHLPELNARLKSLVRRKNYNGENSIELDNLVINIDAKEIIIDGKEVSFTKKEFELLIFLYSNKNKVLTKRSIAQHIWGDYMDHSVNFDFIYSHLKNLRKKLMQAGAKDYIKTVYGIGYKFST